MYKIPQSLLISRSITTEYLNYQIYNIFHTFICVKHQDDIFSKNKKFNLTGNEKFEPRFSFTIRLQSLDPV